MEREQHRPAWLELMLGLVTLAGTAWMVWAQLPEQERYWMRLSVTGRLRRLAAGLAVREGHAGMGDELAGRNPAARYNAALALSRCRDRLGRALEAMRP